MLICSDQKSKLFPNGSSCVTIGPNPSVHSLSNQTLHCIVHGQTSKLARTRWSCSGAGQVVRPRCKQMQAGADSGGVFYTIRSYCRWAVASLPAKVCCLRGLLPRVVVGPAQTRWSDRPRPSLPQIPAQGWHRTRRPAALMYGGVPPPAGRGQRTGGLQQLGPALQQQVATIVRQLWVLQQIHDFRRVLVRTWRAHLRAPVVVQGKCAHVEFEQGAGDHVQQSRNARRLLLALLLCCRPGLLACDTLALHSCYCSNNG